MKELVYIVPPEEHSVERLKELLMDHKEIQFVSLMGVDLGGNATDEKIPVKLFMEDMETLLKYGIQTDGSSVILHEIATLNNARVDLVPDLDVKWFVDHNYEYLNDEKLPIGTLRIPSYLFHNGKMVGSRAILKKGIQHFKDKLYDVLKEKPYLLKSIGIKSIKDIEEITLTAATELEMWVRTPNDEGDVGKLSTSQILKEQYWKRTMGTVRTAMEESMIFLEKYGLEPEMGHKEVGGVTNKIDIEGNTSFVMEQLEIDWKYSTALQTADHELMAREIIEDVFRSRGLEVTFAAKPIEKVAGSGEHTHVGVAVKLKDGSIKNLFSPKEMTKDYLSEIGYGALMGILKNYEVLNPFIAPSNDAFQRLKPGFEAPVCVVTSLGEDKRTPSRNRSILVGLIRDMENTLATRFEVRAPNPLSNTYLVIAAIYQGMLDGIVSIAKKDLKAEELEHEISKAYGVEGHYLETNRMYRSEEDVFEHYDESERDRLFSQPPATVWENLRALSECVEKKRVLLAGDVFTEAIIKSFELSALEKWEMELKNRILVHNSNILRRFIKCHNPDDATDLDVVLWEKIHRFKKELMKDSLERNSLFTQIRVALDAQDYNLASELQLEMYEKMETVRRLYEQYKQNLF